MPNLKGQPENLDKTKLNRRLVRPEHAKQAAEKLAEQPVAVHKTTRHKANPRFMDAEQRRAAEQVKMARGHFEEWLRATTLSANSRRTYSRVLGAILEAKRTPADWFAWFVSGRKVPPGTMSAYRAAASWVQKWFEEIRHPLAGKEIPPLPGSKGKANERYAMSKPQLEAYLKAVDEVCPTMYRVALHLISWTGLRISEACNLTLADIGVRRAGAIGVLVREAKGGKERWVPLPPEARKLLAEYQAKRRSGSKYLFPAERRFGAPIDPNRLREYHVKTLKALPEPFASELADLKVHGLRHTYASRLIEKGAPIVAVRDLMGHARVSTTEIYTHSLPASLAKMAAKLWEDD